MKFSEELKKIREYVGDQIDVAPMIGINITTLSLYETGKRIPKVHRQREILEILGDKVLELSQSELMRKRRLNGII